MIRVSRTQASPPQRSGFLETQVLVSIMALSRCPFPFALRCQRSRNANGKERGAIPHVCANADAPAGIAGTRAPSRRWVHGAKALTGVAGTRRVSYSV